MWGFAAFSLGMIIWGLAKTKKPEPHLGLFN